MYLNLVNYEQLN